MPYRPLFAAGHVWGALFAAAPGADILRDLAEGLKLELLFQLLLAILLGGAIGLERELRAKPAGLRTNLLICMGATLFTVLSARLASPSGDAGRIAAQIVTGIGFLGAGTILHQRGSVTGITTAATVWMVAAIGMAVGARAYVEAVGSTFLTLAVLAGLPPLESRLARRAGHLHLIVRTPAQPGAVERLEALVSETGVEVERCHVRREHADLVLEFELSGSRRRLEQARAALLDRATVESAETGE